MLLRRLSVFAGPFTLDAAEIVAGADVDTFTAAGRARRAVAGHAAGTATPGTGCSNLSASTRWVTCRSAARRGGRAAGTRPIYAESGPGRAGRPARPRSGRLARPPAGASTATCGRRSPPSSTPARRARPDACSRTRGCTGPCAESPPRASHGPIAWSPPRLRRSGRSRPGSRRPPVRGAATAPARRSAGRVRRPLVRGSRRSGVVGRGARPARIGIGARRRVRRGRRGPRPRRDGKPFRRRRVVRSPTRSSRAGCCIWPRTSSRTAWLRSMRRRWSPARSASPFTLATLLNVQASLALLAGDDDAALDLLDEAAQLAAVVGTTWTLVYTLPDLASGRGAARVVGAGGPALLGGGFVATRVVVGRRLRRRTGGRRTRCLAAAREHLDEVSSNGRGRGPGRPAEDVPASSPDRQSAGAAHRAT